MAELLKAGITVGEAFLLLAENEDDAHSCTVLNDLYKQVDVGSSVSSAMRSVGAFPEYMLRMVEIGEKTGALDSTLISVANYYDKQIRLRRTIRTAVTYPLILLVVILSVFFVFVTEVLPIFSSVYEQIGAELSPIAAAFLNFGTALASAKWVILAAVICLLAACSAVYLIPSLRSAAVRFFSRIFAGTDAGKKTTAASIAAVFALVVPGTSDTAEAMALANDFMSGSAGSDKTAQIARLTASGSSLADAAKESAVFTPAYCRMLAISEKAGSTDSVMQLISDRTADERDAAIERLTGRIDPAAVIILSVCVGLLLLSVMLPLVGIMSAL